MMFSSDADAFRVASLNLSGVKTNRKVDRRWLTPL